jgi:phospholipid/cholesterol/gamma-HCH transport system substrate-binding protein
MSRRASPTLIGAFVVGAAALVLIGIVVFGSGRFFQKEYPFVAYFDGNVNGLGIGAPVKFKGVEIGSVTHIFIEFEQADKDARVPVYFVLDQTKLAKAGVHGEIADPKTIDAAIEHGLRAQLQSESLVTGVLFVQLNYVPGSPANLIGTPNGTTEIPTLPTQIEQAQSAVKQILAKFDEINFRGLIEELTKAAEGIAQFSNSKEFQQTIVELNETMRSVQKLAGELGKSIEPLSDTLQRTAERTDAVGVELEKTLETTRTLIAPDAPLAVDLRRALDDLRDAARAVQSLADELDRNPSSIVFGRDVEGGEKR